MFSGARDKLQGLYWKTERLITPGLRFSQQYYEDELQKLVSSHTRWLDLGCGHQVLPPWRLEAERELVGRAGQVIGIDPDVYSIGMHRTIQDVRVGTSEHLPFPDCSFDLITANMVVEHLPEPRTSFREVGRVLRPGGTFLFHTPNIRGHMIALARWFPDWVKRGAARLLEGRSTQDVYPTHYLCNSEESIRKVTCGSDMELIRLLYVPSSAAFGVILPVAVFELLWIRATMKDSMASYRANIIVTLKRANGEKNSPYVG